MTSSPKPNHWAAIRSSRRQVGDRPLNQRTNESFQAIAVSLSRLAGVGKPRRRAAILAMK